MADGTIDNLQIVVTAETKKAESALKNLVKTLEPFKKFASEMGSASGIDKIVDTNGIKNGTSALRKMSEEAAKVSKQYKESICTETTELLRSIWGARSTRWYCFLSSKSMTFI